MNNIYMNTLYITGIKKYLLHFLKTQNLQDGVLETSWETGYQTGTKNEFIWFYYNTVKEPNIKWLEYLAVKYQKLDFALDYSAPILEEQGLYIASDKGIIKVD